MLSDEDEGYQTQTDIITGEKLAINEIPREFQFGDQDLQWSNKPAFNPCLYQKNARILEKYQDVDSNYDCRSGNYLQKQFGNRRIIPQSEVGLLSLDVSYEKRRGVEGDHSWPARTGSIPTMIEVPNDFGGGDPSKEFWDFNNQEWCDLQKDWAIKFPLHTPQPYGNYNSQEERHPLRKFETLSEITHSFGLVNMDSTLRKGIIVEGDKVQTPRQKPTIGSPILDRLVEERQPIEFPKNKLDMLINHKIRNKTQIGGNSNTTHSKGKDSGFIVTVANKVLMFLRDKKMVQPSSVCSQILSRNDIADGIRLNWILGQSVQHGFHALFSEWYMKVAKMVIDGKENNLITMDEKKNRRNRDNHEQSVYDHQLWKIEFLEKSLITVDDYITEFEGKQ